MPDIIALVDELLRSYAGLLAGQFPAYRNHACRVASFHCLLAPVQGAGLQKVAVAAAFHDLGIWTAGTLDYLEPSIRLAQSHLRDCGCAAWATEVASMIRDHHKITRCVDCTMPAVESFRRADWIDVSAGSLRFGLPRKAVAEVRRRFPGEGFHRLLLRLSLRRVVTHPSRPLPMFRW